MSLTSSRPSWASCPCVVPCRLVRGVRLLWHVLIPLYRASKDAWKIPGLSQNHLREVVDGALPGEEGGVERDDGTIKSRCVEWSCD